MVQTGNGGFLVNKNVRRLTDGAMMIAITAVFLLLDRALANTLTYYLMFIMPLPMVFYGAKYGWKGSWAVYAALILVAFVVTTPQYIFYVAAEGFLGMAYGCGIYNKRPQNQLVIEAMVIGVIVNLIDTVIISAMLGYDLTKQTAEMTSMMNQAFEQSGLTMPSNVDLSSMIRELIIVTAILSGVLEGYVTHVLSRLMLKRLRFPVDAAQPLLLYYPPKWTGYAALAGFVIYIWTNTHSIANATLLSVLQAYGLIGYFYLIFFGMIAVAGMLALRGNPKRRVLYGILAFIVALSLSYVAMVLGFLYISAHLHDQILANGGNSHAEKNQ